MENSITESVMLMVSPKLRIGTTATTPDKTVETIPSIF